MESEPLQALGIRVRRVVDLDEKAVYLPRYEILLLDAELTDFQVSGAIEHLLPRLFAT